MLLLILPQWLVHRIDPWSPLWPQMPARDNDNVSSMFQFPDVLHRDADLEAGARERKTDAPPRVPTEAELRDHLISAEVEVLALVEGIDASTGNTVQVQREPKEKKKKRRRRRR